MHMLLKISTAVGVGTTMVVEMYWQFPSIILLVGNSNITCSFVAPPCTLHIHQSELARPNWIHHRCWDLHTRSKNPKTTSIDPRLCGYRSAVSRWRRKMFPIYPLQYDLSKSSESRQLPFPYPRSGEYHEGWSESKTIFKMLFSWLWDTTRWLAARNVWWNMVLVPSYTYLVEIPKIRSIQESRVQRRQECVELVDGIYF